MLSLSNTSFYYDKTISIVNNDEFINSLLEKLSESNIVESTKKMDNW